MSATTAPRRMNFGCGSCVEAGWTNVDVKGGPGIDVSCDVRAGLPLPDDHFDYIVSIHALPELAVLEIVPALRELLRVLRPNGTLRLGLPDLERALAAYRRGDRGYFAVPDADAASIGAKLALQMTWYGYSRSLYTPDAIAEWLERAGFAAVSPCAFGITASPHAEIVDLDNRETESLFVEAVKPGRD
jgi:predicted SAM-dependent methyltransferase